MRVIITCGGTGGHITPGLAIADIIRANAPGARILFVGAEGGMEQEMVTRAHYPIRSLRVRGLARKLSFEAVQALRMMKQAVKEAEGLLADFAPDIVIGTGGYACYPTLRAAIKRGIPTAVHESNSVPGLAVRRLSGGVDRVWLNFESAKGGLSRGAKSLTVGNPLPASYVRPTPRSLPQGTRRMLLSFGGSLGASELNRTALCLMERVKTRPEVFYLHATGKRCFDEVHRSFCERGLERYPNLCLSPFVSDMPNQMSAADLVICRAGAMSISELASLGCPAILVPSPNVTGDHQMKNAQMMAQAGAALCLREEQLDALPDTALRLLEDRERLRALSDAARGFYRSDANAVIWRDICSLCQKR